MTDLVGVHSAPDALPSASQTFLLDVWKVDPQCAGRHIQQLTTLVDEISDQPGFVSASILESADRSSIGAVVEASSVEARRDLEQLPQVQNVLDLLHAGVGVLPQSSHDVTACDGRGSDPSETSGIGTRMIKRLPSPPAGQGGARPPVPTHATTRRQRSGRGSTRSSPYSTSCPRRDLQCSS